MAWSTNPWRLREAANTESCVLRLGCILVAPESSSVRRLRARNGTGTATRCDYCLMHRRKVYLRPTAQGAETLEIVAYIDETGGDDETRVTHTVNGDVVDDGIGFSGPGGEQWLQDRRTGWTADGFQ